MMKKVCTIAVLAGLAFPMAAGAGDDDDAVLRFDGGIGSQPLRANAQPNLVRGFSPGGAPWVIRALDAEVTRDGKISVKGRGLLLGGGDNIGTTNGQSVRAVLLCVGQPNSQTDPLVLLQADGDFRIRDVLSPLPPANCVNPVLLIVGSGGNWFAAGIPKHR